MILTYYISINQYFFLMNLLHIFAMIAILSQISHAHKLPKYNNSVIIDPEILKPYMFTEAITGQLQIMLPYKKHLNLQAGPISEEYVIQMIKTKQQMLPSSLYNQTTIYAYGGQTKNGYKALFPGPAIFATKDVPIKVTWKNNIKGNHILPVDYNYPFNSSKAFKDQVPTVPHAHGVASTTSSDGQPEAYWTASGIKAPHYKTEQPCAANEAVYYYPNEQDSGNNWYHDHAMGITRLNVYAGLAGFYKIIDKNSTSHHKEIYLRQRYGFQVNENQTKFLIVADKTFKTNGQLFYPSDTSNPQFSSWIPQFYGNTMTVNGIVWPKMNLKKGKYRFVLLNACQNRYLNIYFENGNKRIPFQLIRIDQDYFDNQVVVSQFFATLANRIEFIIDLTNVQGEVILKNNAQAPYPQGDPANLVPQFTGQIMKIVIQNNQLSLDEGTLVFEDIQTKVTLSQLNYPTFPEGQKVFSTLFQVHGVDGDVNAMFIDGVSMSLGMNCANSTYKLGKVYDFYFINLTPDTHPIHFHLVNIQKVKQFEFDVQAYTAKYFEINGGQPDKHGYKQVPKSLDPESFRTGQDQYPKEYQKIFKDTIDAHPGLVTVMRIKFSKNDGTVWKKINTKSARYVYHCHMLQHEDNEMMKYYCLE